MAILPFNERKATEAAARLLRLRGGRMSYMKLIKLLYLVDREALLRWGQPVTTDRYVSMDHGPVLSHVYSLISKGAPPGAKSVWQEHISPPRNYEVSLVREPEASELSRAEEKLIDEIFARFGGKSRWDLVDYCHALPEWKDPEGSALPLETRDILKAAGKSDDEIAELEGSLAELAAIERLAIS